MATMGAESANAVATPVTRLVAPGPEVAAHTPAFLDFAVSADATDSTAVFEITAEATDDLEAMAGALSWVRAAIHAAGGATPGWSIAGVGAVEVEALATTC